jgi:hypothetical protein
MQRRGSRAVAFDGDEVHGASGEKAEYPRTERLHPATQTIPADPEIDSIRSGTQVWPDGAKRPLHSFRLSLPGYVIKTADDESSRIF